MTFLLFLRSNWKPIAFTLSAFLCFASGWRVSSLISERERITALADQKAALEQTCAEDKRITEKANHDLQENYSAIARKLADAKRLRPARCVVPTADAADTAARGGEHARPDGVSADALRDFAADCEVYRSERMTLEEFIADERH